MIIKNIDGSTNPIINELNAKSNSDESGYNQSR